MTNWCQQSKVQCGNKLNLGRTFRKFAIRKIFKLLLIKKKQILSQKLELNGCHNFVGNLYILHTEGLKQNFLKALEINTF